MTAVQILVDGREVDTLAGHIDLRQPLTPNLTWVVDLPSSDGESPPGEDDDLQPPSGTAPDEPESAGESGASTPGRGVP